MARTLSREIQAPAIPVLLGLTLVMGAISANVPVVRAQTDSPSVAAPGASELMQLGDRKYMDGDYQGAITVYSQVLASFSENEYAYYHRGNAYRKLENYPAAIADYTNAIQLNAQNRFAFLYRGMAHAALKDYKAAIADYTQVLQVNKQDPVAYHRRAEAYEALQDNKAAIADYQEAIELYSKQNKELQAAKLKIHMDSLKR